MPKVKLDAAYCAAATCSTRKKKTDYWDKDLKGFVLEVRPSGGKTYYLRYTDAGGRQRQVKLGGHADITFAAAKRKAQQLRSEVTLGGDPRAKQRKRRAVPLYAELAEQHKAYAATYQKRPENTVSVIDTHLLPHFGKLRLDEITEQEVAKFLADKRKVLAPATVEKIRMMLSRSFELARGWSLPGAEVNPVRGVPKQRFDNARQRYLSPEEARRLLEACERSSNPQLKAIVHLLLLTGARKGELLQAKWEHLDLDQRTWLIPDSKTGKARLVPLSGEAVAVIEGLVELQGCPWLLPNPLTLQPYTTIKRAWKTALREAGIKDLRLHDLRHSAASFMVNSGVDLYTVGKILGHADHQSTIRYSHLANDTLMKAVEAGAAKLGEAA